MIKRYDVTSDKFREVTQEEFDNLDELLRTLIDRTVETDRALTKIHERLKAIVRRLREAKAKKEDRTNDTHW